MAPSALLPHTKLQAGLLGLSTKGLCPRLPSPAPQAHPYLLGPGQGCLLQLVVTVLGICAYRHPWKEMGPDQPGVDVWVWGQKRGEQTQLLQGPWGAGLAGPQPPPAQRSRSSLSQAVPFRAQTQGALAHLQRDRLGRNPCGSSTCPPTATQEQEGKDLGPRASRPHCSLPGA